MLDSEELPRASYIAWGRQELSIYKTGNFVLKAPRDARKPELDRVVRILDSARIQMTKRLEAAGVGGSEGSAIEVMITATTEQFIRETGLPGWAAAASADGAIVIQPVVLLERRGVLETTLRHEYVHTVLERLSHERAPRWMSEGLAIYFAGEAQSYAGVPRLTISDEELDRRLRRPQSREEMRRLYAESYRRVREMINREGESIVVRRLVAWVRWRSAGVPLATGALTARGTPAGRQAYPGSDVFS
jgi:hypothetical protein